MVNTIITQPSAVENYIELDAQYAAHNYHPLPVVLEKGRGARVWDVNGREYLDFLSGYSALNQGHCHPRLVKALMEQASRLTLTSRAFHHSLFGKFAEKITGIFGYNKVLPMNTGVEAVETAIKLARKWGYEVKGVPENQAKIIVCQQNFHGRTTTVVSFSSDHNAREGFGPYTSGFVSIPFNDVSALEAAVSDSSVVAFLVEPIQGEAGVIVPDENYLQKVSNICRQNSVLFMADEVQTGLGRTGKMLACDHENVRPDVLILGKALGGGVIPVSAVLSDDEIMLTIKPGQHGSTFGGNPLACAVAIEALDIIIEEGLAEKANVLGNIFRNEISRLESAHIKDVRGRGLLNAIELTSQDDRDAMTLSIEFMNRGLLAKPTQGNKIRLSPPLVISNAEVIKAIQIIKDSLKVFD